METRRPLMAIASIVERADTDRLTVGRKKKTKVSARVIITLVLLASMELQLLIKAKAVE
jgi:hypothetical protein